MRDPMFEKGIKITEDYTFDSELNTIVESVTVTSYMMSEGEWVGVSQAANGSNGDTRRENRGVIYYIRVINV